MVTSESLWSPSPNSHQDVALWRTGMKMAASQSLAWRSQELKAPLLSLSSEKSSQSLPSPSSLAVLPPPVIKRFYLWCMGPFGVSNPSRYLQYTPMPLLLEEEGKGLLGPAPVGSLPEKQWPNCALDHGLSAECNRKGSCPAWSCISQHSLPLHRSDAMGHHFQLRRLKGEHSYPLGCSLSATLFGLTATLEDKCQRRQSPCQDTHRSGSSTLLIIHPPGSEKSSLIMVMRQ
ncbi:uncharacterized protein LOC125101317 isoform X2 [Lutra lutra]|uniref:uncharacterized protein LOC125101317 isoform X2 n=1 Tax=Lutra lutra TaxID=9657 RepID=UPI001FD1D2B1|nr:uncharacterized protein LOC125101317 isoform X2 [Lutra lutra]